MRVDYISGGVLKSRTHTFRQAETVFLPFTTGYFLSYLLCIFNNEIADVLMAGFGLNAGGLGLLIAAFFLTFAACQLRVGILPIVSDPSISRLCC
jgi:hypothetical protein